MPLGSACTPPGEVNSTALHSGEDDVMKKIVCDTYNIYIMAYTDEVVIIIVINNYYYNNAYRL